uniref:Copia protein n=1 Tax=Tanacetum cinerariifolium TaxID=118510 RepID=A0A6L2J2P2_TANCI|nr:copia protein [Tanacetum cinerariifolium]
MLCFYYVLLSLQVTRAQMTRLEMIQLMMLLVERSTPVHTATASRTFSPPHDPLILELEDTAKIQTTGIFRNAYDKDDLDTTNHSYVDESVGVEADFNNMEPSTISVLFPQLDYIQKKKRTNHKDFQNCLFACFLSQHEPTKITQALNDESWVKATQEELLQFKIQKVCTLVDLPYGKKAIGHKQEEVIDYDEVFAHVARVEAIRLFLAFASYMNFPVYQMDGKSAFLYGTIEEEVFVDDIIFGSTKKSLCNEFEQIMHNRFQMSSMRELTFFLGLQVKQKEDESFINQDKYVGEILKKFGFFSIRSASTLMETHKPLTKDEDGEDVDVHLYRSMIRYLKGQPKLGLSYPKDFPLTLEAFFDSNYAGASLDRKSITGSCQFLGSRLISWQCKKQTVVANSTTKVEYIAASHCCGQVLWI